MIYRDRRPGRGGHVIADLLPCATCGRALDRDRDEDPTGDAGRPICGECARERDFFVMDVSDGVLDGRIDTDRTEDEGDGSFDD